jgi:hypothetical protein
MLCGSSPSILIHPGLPSVPLSLHQEYCEDCEGEKKVVRRDPALADNAQLPAAFSTLVGDMVYTALRDGFEVGDLARLLRASACVWSAGTAVLLCCCAAVLLCCCAAVLLCYDHSCSCSQRQAAADLAMGCMLDNAGRRWRPLCVIMDPQHVHTGARHHLATPYTSMDAIALTSCPPDHRPQGEVFGAPAPCSPGAPLTEVAQQLQQLLAIMTDKGYALKCEVAEVQPDSPGSSSGSLVVRTQGPATMWGLLALSYRRAAVANAFDAMVAGAFLRASGRQCSYSIELTDVGVEHTWLVA